MARVLLMYKSKIRFFAASSAFANSFTSIKRANRRSSWNFENRSFFDSASGREPAFDAIALRSGTRMPRKVSPSPYSPGPVLKNHSELAARFGSASFSSVFVISIAVVNFLVSVFGMLLLHYAECEMIDGRLGQIQLHF